MHEEKKNFSKLLKIYFLPATGRTGGVLGRWDEANDASTKKETEIKHKK
jgi:hypothetical protein